MLEHSRFEELCALAAVGQIAPDEMSELRAHLQECPSCKQAESDFLEVNAIWLTQAAGTESGLPASEAALKAKILGKLQDSGAHFSKPVTRQNADTAVVPFAAPVRRNWTQVPIWAVAAMFLIGGLLGFAIASRRRVPAPIVAQQDPPPAVIVPAPQSAPAPPSANSAKNLEQNLVAADTERANLRNQIQSLHQQIASLQDERKRDADVLSQLRSTADANESAAQSAQAELKQLKDAQSAKDAEIVAAQYRMRELEDKLKQQDESERQLMAKGGSELRDLIGARNLHIIDVADVAAGGVKKPFGRVFYTEGKSLIFYAYDLSKTKGNQTFYVWGRREGDPQSNHALGALRNDDANQQRWVFDFSNTKVLASIDSVYVTLEPTDKPGSQPKGRKLLNAYLGTPANHP